MPEYTQEQLWIKFKELPANVRDAIFSAKTAEIIYNAADRNKSLDVVSDIAYYVGLALLGVLEKNNFEQTLVKNIGMEPENAQKISAVINQQIFEPLKLSTAEPKAWAEPKSQAEEIEKPLPPKPAMPEIPSSKPETLETLPPKSPISPKLPPRPPTPPRPTLEPPFNDERARSTIIRETLPPPPKPSYLETKYTSRRDIYREEISGQKREMPIGAAIRMPEQEQKKAGVIQRPIEQNREPQESAHAQMSPPRPPAPPRRFEAMPTTAKELEMAVKNIETSLRKLDSKPDKTIEDLRILEDYKRRLEDLASLKRRNHQ